jgi:hypothetical protein
LARRWKGITRRGDQDKNYDDQKPFNRHFGNDP